VRTLGLLIAIGLAACGSGDAGDEAPARLPGLLHRLVLNEGDDEMTPVSYGHLFHLDEAAMGRAVACVDCHHHLEGDPTGIPVACGTCHPHETGDPRSVEGPAAEAGKPPDI